MKRSEKHVPARKCSSAPRAPARKRERERERESSFNIFKKVLEVLDYMQGLKDVWPNILLPIPLRRVLPEKYCEYRVET